MINPESWIQNFIDQLAIITDRSNILPNQELSTNVEDRRNQNYTNNDFVRDRMKDDLFRIGDSVSWIPPKELAPEGPSIIDILTDSLKKRKIPDGN